MSHLNHIFHKLFALCLLTFSVMAFGQTPTATQVLVKNVRVFDGVSDTATAPTSVLVVGNKIQEISDDAAASASSDATIIDGGGRVLIPGLSDNHTHMSFVTLPVVLSQTSGHFNFRYQNQGNPRFGGVRAEADNEGYMHVVDGEAEV